jgi:steroid delta-isomerase-like uncharacterized protein
MSSVDADNRALAEAYVDAWNRHDPEAIAALHTEDAVFENHTSGGHAIGPRAIAEIAAAVFRTFPDIRFVARRRYVSAALIVDEWTATGTQAQPMTRDGRTIAPSGRAVQWNGVDIMPVRDGKIARKDVYVDSNGLWRALESR